MEGGDKPRHYKIFVAAGLVPALLGIRKVTPLAHLILRGGNFSSPGSSYLKREILEGGDKPRHYKIFVAAGLVPALLGIRKGGDSEVAPFRNHPFLALVGRGLR